jgi:hypothetical protein
VKTNFNALLIVLALLGGVDRAAAQNARFFRIAGPTATTITAFNPDGTLVWSNAIAGSNYTVQTASCLPGGTNWVDYIQFPATQVVNTNLIVSFTAPAGMALIPAGVFIMGDTLDGESDAAPTNVTVSAFYMDVDLVSLSQGAIGDALKHSTFAASAGRRLRRRSGLDRAWPCRVGAAPPC